MLQPAQTGSGGLGAVSAGFTEMIIEFLGVAIIVVLLIALWKLGKFLLALLHG